MEGHILGGFHGYYDQHVDTYSQTSDLQLHSHDSHLRAEIQPTHDYGTAQSTTFQYPTPRLKPGHGSTSTQSSFASRGAFSDFSNRDSVASTATNVSRFSNIAEEALTTCVSRKERAKPADKPTKPAQFWCTSCGKSFGSKHDWKTHEEIFQERFEEYWCEMDEKTFFSKKDFTNHHYKSHNCRTCVKFGHAEGACRKRRSRSAWGCGFCIWLGTDWNERCDHIASHFRENKTLKEWKQTFVIWSLLRRPGLQQAWIDLMERKKIQNPKLGWNLHNTGRAEAFPDSDRTPQLQDLLEWYTEDQDPYLLVELALEKGLRQVESVPRSPPGSTMTLYNSTGAVNAFHERSTDLGISSQPTIRPSTTRSGTAPLQATPPARYRRQDKALPPDPPKDRFSRGSINAVDEGPNVNVSWDRFSTTVVPDATLPDASSMELDHTMRDLGSDDFSWTSWLAE